MSLTLRQQWETLQAVKLIGNELDNDVSALDQLAKLNDEYDGQVATFLANVITAEEWAAVRAQIVIWRDMLWGRVNAEQGDGLDALRLPEEEPE